MTEAVAAPPHVVAFRFDGPHDPSAAETIYTALDAATREHDEVALYVEIGWVHGLKAGTFVEGVRRGLGRLSAEARVRRVAVVTGSYERRHLVRTESAEADGVQVEVFPVAARSAALEWAAAGGRPRVYVA